jgi:hypothetical protein
MASNISELIAHLEKRRARLGPGGVEVSRGKRGWIMLIKDCIPASSQVRGYANTFKRSSASNAGKSVFTTSERRLLRQSRVEQASQIVAAGRRFLGQK